LLLIGTLTATLATTRLSRIAVGKRWPMSLGKSRTLTFVAVLINVLITAVFGVVDSAVTKINLAVIAAVAILPFLLHLHLLFLMLLQLLPLIILF
jgi:hypothetical protein